jgi:diacylglycerol O-acyltransferase / wax synthase
VTVPLLVRLYVPEEVGTPMSIKAISPLDAAFLLIESDDMPWHAALLMLFTLPDDATASFVPELVDRMRGPHKPVSPFNLAPAYAKLPQLPFVREVDTIDVDYHVVVHCLPQPGGEDELNSVIGELHSRRLDPSRPLWELHLIEGLADNRFAAFIKIHHSLADGVTGMRRLLQWLTPNPAADPCSPLFTVGPTGRVDTPVTPRRGLRAARKQLAARATAGHELSRTIYEMMRRTYAGQALTVPYRTPKTVWHGRIDSDRSIAYTQFELSRLKALADATDTKFSDIAFYTCGSALRTYLAEHADVPSTPLTAGVPMSTRDENDNRPGSAFGFITVDLATNIADPIERLQTIARSNATATEQLSHLSEPGLVLQPVLANGPMIAALALRFGKRTPAAFGLVMSNIPGPKVQLYLDGARLDALVPVSVPMHNSPVNMTCIGHGDKITFGIAVATRNVPDVGHIAAGLEKAIVDLERQVAARKAA